MLRSAELLKDSRDVDSDGLMNEYEEEVGTDPSLPDTDGDGVPDGIEELNETDPQDASDFEVTDSDGDGVADPVEVTFGSNPLSKDADNDQLSDPAEILFGFDPTNPDTNHDGIVDGFQRGGRNYRFVNKLIHF